MKAAYSAVLPPSLMVFFSQRLCNGFSEEKLKSGYWLCFKAAGIHDFPFSQSTWRREIFPTFSLVQNVKQYFQPRAKHQLPTFYLQVLSNKSKLHTWRKSFRVLLVKPLFSDTAVCQRERPDHIIKVIYNLTNKSWRSQCSKLVKNSNNEPRGFHQSE